MPIAVALLLLAAGHPESAAAFADRERLPPESRANAAYLSLAEVVPAERERLESVLRFVVPSLSSKPYLGDQLPVRVAGTNLLRLDLGGLGWEASWPAVVSSKFVPVYRPDLAGSKHVPLVVPGIWLAAVVTDSTLSGTAQYELLYGKAPANAKEFQAFWQANTNPQFSFGRIEGQSGVAVQRARLIENLPTANRGYLWNTYDSRVVAGATDPLENLTARPPKHDASELIAGIPKHYAGKSGSLQAYFLAAADGKRQEKAPADIVTDSTGIRGVEIRNTLSCISCHDAGLQHPNIDAYREYILSGARILAKEKNVQRQIDQYFDSPIAKEIQRNNADYAEAIALVNGLTPKENADNFRAVVKLYDQPVTAEQAALEMYVTAEEWRLALGNYSRTGKLTGRLALMAQGQSMSRDQWQNNYTLAQQVLTQWQASK